MSCNDWLPRSQTHTACSIALSIIAGAAALPAAAQTQLPGIVVEGATIQARPIRPPADAESVTTQGTIGGAEADGIPIDRVGSAVTVVTRQQLERQQIRHAADALRSLPGVHVSRTGGFAGETQVRIRGAEANHTLVLIDGVVANQPGTGEFDFALLSTDQIERIEVIRGAQSGLYGSGAIGGVINIVTRSGRGPPTARVWSEIGSFKTVEGGVTVSGGGERAHGLVSYSARQANGFNIASEGSETDAFQRRNLFVKAGIKPTDVFALDFFLRNDEKRGDRDDDLFCCTGLSRQTDSFSNFATSFWLGGIEGRLDTFGGALSHKVKINHAETALKDTLIPLDMSFSSLSRNENERSNFTYLATWRFDTPGPAGSARHFLTGLVEKEIESFTPLTGTNITSERDRVATAVEYRGEFADRLFVTGNIRHDDNSTFTDFTTWRAAASLQLKEWGLRPHASVGTGVRLPTMVEQFGQFSGFIPNPDLLPEESLGWDVGIEKTFLQGRAVVDVTYFNTDLKNEIFTDFLMFPAITVGNRLGKSTREGIEVAARWHLLPVLSVGGALTWLDARDDAGLEVIRRPRHSGRVDVSYGFAEGRANVTLAAAFNGRAHDIAFVLPAFDETRVTLDDYWLLSAALAYKVQSGIELFGRVENLLDANYQEIYGFNTPGVAAYGGVRITLGGEEGLAFVPAAGR